MNKRVATLNVPALWSPIPVKGMSVRTYQDSLPYMADNNLGVATEEHPVYRYAHNFMLDGLEFSLCLFSDESSKTKVTNYFKTLVEKLTKQDVGKALMAATNSNFTYLEESYGGKS